MTDSGQLDVVDLLWTQQNAAEDALGTLEATLSEQIDSNPNDKLLMDMFDLVTDSRQSLRSARDLLQTMQNRDESELT